MKRIGSLTKIDPKEELNKRIRKTGQSHCLLEVGPHWSLHAGTRAAWEWAQILGVRRAKRLGVSEFRITSEGYTHRFDADGNTLPRPKPVPVELQHGPLGKLNW